jgi:hypothetical protein
MLVVYTSMMPFPLRIKAPRPSLASWGSQRTLAVMVTKKVWEKSLNVTEYKYRA